ncbi:protein translocase subunit SecF [Candidatus Shapirobacteria bacterium CG08_land_8_20_14_0_20_39_18]|uniref:Protein-export membrane protein SecF n=1 Tax=Candidatus Shapirobacteria bacterium CG08_land_8_20_14_0_20_39_18 TaxID=1974883 RepID=A0A2M6XE34_9BACT|nr:MAG: protein translocase subunit SecF [Candidatus Shapirobacteria bacterium CG08_land_8_20_14_0_20_39_18]PIY64704.1 MAG: protein translocase subunit SecF [Candidatus Shapirobacteria bacterium CG_4_10_14_0_8_um_filter_39_15]PJE68771.1 MAG: protein translocase subunit SecF [Candidatus Shapirobacteria bacterium CG10_big_fil_rev_8_21_14_0_10_38_8]
MINFMKFKWLYFLLSAIVLVPGIISLLLFGLKPSIDFTGGSLLEYRFDQKVDQSKIESVLKDKKINYSSIQLSGENTYLIRAASLDAQMGTVIKTALEEQLKQTPQEFRFENVGPILGQELLIKTFMAILLAAGFIMSYVGYAFKNLRFGICAILAMFHDSFVMLGIFSLLGHFAGVEVDTLFVTAMMTILSFSVHDTVVVYDRIRESQKKMPGVSLVDLINKAVTETMSRSLNNSLTIIFMLLALFLLGGDTVKWFTFALLIGTISGTYSSTFTAAPLLVIWDIIEKRGKGKG